MLRFVAPRRCPTQPEILFRIENCIGTAILNRPGRKNAIGRQLISELRDAIRLCGDSAHGVRCLIVASAVPGVFCSGADLKERREMSVDAAREFVDQLRSTFCEMEDLSIPTIAVIEGKALGGGLELALACDLRIAGDGSELGVPETSLGIIPGAGGTQRLSKTVGLAFAKELSFTALPITAERAERIGLVNGRTPGGHALAEAQRIATRIADNGPIAVRAAKSAIAGGFGKPRSEGMEIERVNYEKVLASKDRIEGLRAFVEKRKPQYRGE